MLNFKATRIHGTKLMTFTTQSQGIAKRGPKHTVSGKSIKLGRPPNTESERIRTIAWFNAVKIALEVDTLTAFGNRLQEASDAFGHKGWSGDLTSTKKWSRYANGENSPSLELLLFVDKVVPNSAHVFQCGPSDLWTVLWADNEFQIGYEDAGTLSNINFNNIDFAWLCRGIAAWRKLRSADGLYEIVMVGLDSPAIKAQLELLNVWKAVRANVMATERRNLVCDVRRTEELQIIGRYFLQMHDPIESYLADPVRFLLRVESANALIAPLCSQFSEVRFGLNFTKSRAAAV